MAVEAKRGCGYRKVGGLYLVGGGIGVPCDRLPFELTVCPCCNVGIKTSLGWTWIRPGLLFQGPHIVKVPLRGPSLVDIRDLADGINSACDCSRYGCWLCSDPGKFEKAGLLWVGEKFYKTPEQFLTEGLKQGLSKRIATVPHGFKIGETPVFLAHKKACLGILPREEKPGIFYVWIPQRLEVIMKESERDSEKAKDFEKRDIVPVYVPDNDKDHQGRVYDKVKEV